MLAPGETCAFGYRGSWTIRVDDAPDGLEIVEHSGNGGSDKSNKLGMVNMFM